MSTNGPPAVSYNYPCHVCPSRSFDDSSNPSLTSQEFRSPLLSRTQQMVWFSIRALPSPCCSYTQHAASVFGVWLCPYSNRWRNRLHSCGSSLKYMHSSSARDLSRSHFVEGFHRGWEKAVSICISCMKHLVLLYCCTWYDV